LQGRIWVCIFFCINVWYSQKSIAYIWLKRKLFHVHCSLNTLKLSKFISLFTLQLDRFSLCTCYVVLCDCLHFRLFTWYQVLLDVRHLLLFTHDVLCSFWNNFHSNDMRSYLAFFILVNHVVHWLISLSKAARCITLLSEC
jgi:hypothetical protein